jgi:hypothetical protein
VEQAVLGCVEIKFFIDGSVVVDKIFHPFRVKFQG